MLKNMKRILSITMVLCTFFSLTGGLETVSAAAPPPAKAKNVIILIPDGMNASEVALARWYTGAKLAMDEILVGAAINYNSNSIITDSAPAATAIATGYKSDNKYISVSPYEITVPAKQEVAEKDAYVPLASVLEAAKLKGKATGIIATANIQHATPAGFSAHNPSRSDYFDIAEQQVHQNMDVVFGGGRKYLTINGDKGRKDGDDLIAQLKKMGYAFVEDAAAFKALDPKRTRKVWGMFADDAMAYDKDRDSAKEPSLSEMAKKAIDILSQDKDGFFLFVEGSKIDWASHANDPAGVISDVVAFDKAVRVALDFAKKDKNTLVISLTDHGTGGMTIGNAQTTKGYDSLQLSSLIDPLKKVKLTGEGLAAKLNPDFSNLAEVMQTYYGISDLTKEETEQIMAAMKDIKDKKVELNGIVGPMLSKRSCIGWTTGGHTGEDVFVYAFGPGKPAGLIDNTDIARIIAAAMGTTLEEASQKLFVNVAVGLGTINGATSEMDTTDNANPALVIKKGTKKIVLPVSKNIMIINGIETKTFNGLTILSKNGDVFVPQQALDMIKSIK